MLKLASSRVHHYRYRFRGPIEVLAPPRDADERRGVRSWRLALPITTTSRRLPQDEPFDLPASKTTPSIAFEIGVRDRVAADCGAVHPASSATADSEAVRTKIQLLTHDSSPGGTHEGSESGLH